MPKLYMMYMSAYGAAIIPFRFQLIFSNNPIVALEPLYTENIPLFECKVMNRKKKNFSIITKE